MDVCPVCGSTAGGGRDAVERLTQEVARLREVAEGRRVEELDREVRLLRETVARLRGSLGVQHA